MTRVNTPILTESQRQEREHLYKTSPKHVIRKNCHTIVLKANGRTSKDVGHIVVVGMTDVSVNSWLRRYKTEGISGLTIKPGRGRKAIMEKSDTESVRETIDEHRQRAETARAEWQEASGKKASRTTFRNFLIVLADDINVEENGAMENQTLSCMPINTGVCKSLSVLPNKDSSTSSMAMRVVFPVKGMCHMTGNFPVKILLFLFVRDTISISLGLSAARMSAIGQQPSRTLTGSFFLTILTASASTSRGEHFLFLNTASVHSSKAFREQMRLWQERGLFIFFLPPYSPHLNIAETLWRKLKKEWLSREDYLSKGTLFYAVNRCMANVGGCLSIKFTPFNAN